MLDTMEIIVREPTIEDELEIHAVVGSSLKDLRKVYRPKPDAVVHSCNSQNDRHRIVAVINGQIIGTTEYVFNPYSVHVIGLGVLPEFRQQGVARQLLGYIERIARCHSLSKISLYTICQTGNVPIFERLGFMVIDRYSDQRSESVIGDPLTEAYLEKVLE